jgi:hypothetical protein
MLLAVLLTALELRRADARRFAQPRWRAVPQNRLQLADGVGYRRIRERTGGMDVAPDQLSRSRAANLRAVDHRAAIQCIGAGDDLVLSVLAVSVEEDLSDRLSSLWADLPEIEPLGRSKMLIDGPSITTRERNSHDLAPFLVRMNVELTHHLEVPVVSRLVANLDELVADLG